MTVQLRTHGGNRVVKRYSYISWGQGSPFPSPSRAWSPSVPFYFQFIICVWDTSRIVYHPFFCNIRLRNAASSWTVGNFFVIGSTHGLNISDSLFIFLNVVRLLSVIGLLLVFSSNGILHLVQVVFVYLLGYIVVVLADDIKAVNRFVAQGFNNIQPSNSTGCNAGYIA